MRNPLTRVLGGSVLAVALIFGAGIAPATAATTDAGAVITVKGRVTDPSGHGVGGIVVSSDCGCDYEDPSSVPSHFSGTDTTSSTGYYSYVVRKSIASNTSFSDPDNNYLPATIGDITKKTTASGYTINAEMFLAATLAGTVRDTNGAPVAGMEVRVYDAKTGKEAYTLGTGTDSKGHFHALVKNGTYKIKFRGASYYYGDTWYGGASLKADATAVSVPYGGKTAGVDATVTIKGNITGIITVDGKKAVNGSADRVVVDLLDANGAKLDSRTTYSPYSFVDLAHSSDPVGLAPGNYTLSFRPSAKGSQFFVPKNVPVTIPPGGAARNLVVDLTGVPASSADKRSSSISLVSTTKGRPAIGKLYRTTITVHSYGSTAGGTVTIYVGGKKVATRTLDAAGKATWSTRFADAGKGSHSIRVAYSGTSTTDARKSFVTTVFL